MRDIQRWAGVGLAAGLLALGRASDTEARTLQIERDGSGDYATIQPAIDAAAPGDTLLLGPGRYTETTTTNFPGFTVQSHAVVEKGPLAFVARIPEQTIIGPTVRNDVGFGPHGFSVSSMSTGVVIDGLTIENLFDAVYTSQGMTIRRCTLRNGFHGVSGGTLENLVVDRCILANNDGGISVSQNSSNVMVTRCTFLHNIYHGAGFAQTMNAMVDSCTIVGAGQGITFQQGSYGTLRNSIVADAIQVGVDVALDAVVVVTHTRVTGARWTIAVRARSSATITDGVVSGGADATVYLSGNSSAQITRSHILKGTGYAVETASYPNEPVTRLNLTSNYWGTTSSDSIASWIHDGADDPSIKAVVDFEPILLHPVPVPQSSLGALKARFRRE